MDESPLLTFLSMESNHATAATIPQTTWTSETETSLHVLDSSFSTDNISVTGDHAVIALLQSGWTDSSLGNALGYTQPPHNTPAQSPEPPLTSSCQILSETPCSQPLEGTLLSIRWHLSLHGHKHQGREMVQCPWVGCSDELQWMNIPRHIRSIHLGVRMVCPTCERSFTRSSGLAKHVASKKCFAAVSD